MRASTIASILSLNSLALGLKEQAPLGGEEIIGSNSDSAPSYRDELLDLHKTLVSTQSISGDEELVGKVLSDHLKSLGYTVKGQFVPPRNETPEGEERHNVFAWQGRVPRVVLSSHIDVVPPHIPYEIEDGEVTRDTVIRGRGSVDAKGSVAAMIVALEDLKQAEKVSPEDVGLLFVVGEEVSGDGMQHFSKALEKTSHSFDAVIFGEPTENKLACGHKGALSCQLSVQGVGGHSGYPWVGKSANEILVHALSEIVAADLGSNEVYGNTTINIGRMEGGVAANVIPENAYAKLMIRVATGPEVGGAKVVQDKIRDILDKIDKEAISLSCTEGYGFVEANCDVEGFDTLSVNYGTDIPNLKGNHTRYLYGPGTIFVAHGANENLTVGDLETAVEGYKKLILHAVKH